MALAIRMARGGRRNLPYYQIVVADKRMPRDGRYIEQLGSYNPLLASDDARRVKLNEERIKYWLSQGAQPSRRVQIFLGKAGIMEMPTINETPLKSAPSAKTLERIKQKEEKVKAAEEAAKAAKAEKAAAAEAAKAEAATPAPAEEAAAPAETPAEPAAEKTEG